MGSGDVIIYECGTSAVFTDDNSGTQDAQEPYSCTNNTITFCPDVPGDAVQINFLGFDLQTNANPNNNDALYAYDGDNTGSNLVGVGTGNSFVGVSITASIDNPTGCVTFQFVCNNNATGGDIGWAATISCVTPCSYPVSGLELVSPEPFPNNQEGSISIGLCPDDVITFSAESAFGTDGFALQSLVWNWGDGDVEITEVSDGLIVPHSYAEPGEYIVTLTVVDENECNSTNLQPHQVLVSTLPIFNTEFTTPICAGSPGFLNGDPVQSITWTALPPVGVSELADLPDATGVAFTSELFLDFFEQGQVLENCEDIELITANIEHTFIGDLSFWITCPDGTEVILMDNGASGGPDPTGCTPNDLGGNNLGLADVEGWDYSWNMDAEWVLDDSGNPDVADPMPSGVYLPCEDLCDFVGCPLNGIWTFSVIDQWAADNGTLFGWGIDFNLNIVPSVITFTPVIGLDSDSSFWDVTTFDEGVVFISEDVNYVDLEFPNPGIFDFTYQVTNNFGCTWDTTVNITVIEGPQTNISAGDDVIFCQDPVQLLGVFTGGGPSSCGGSGGSYDYCYSNNENMVFNYCPDIVGDGTMMTLNFSSGTMETCCDFINVFDGPNGTGNLIQTFNTNIPGSTFTATNPDGCISFVLTSDGSVNCEDVWSNFEQLTWCVSCGGQDACGFDWSWTPTEFLDNPFVAQPTVLDFDGQPTAYTLSVEPIGFDNCSATDVVMVLPGFQYEVTDQQPSCLADDGVLIVSINEPLSEGPFTIEFFEGGVLQESLQFDGSDYVLQDLTPGMYSVDLFDATGCLYSYEFEMLDPVPMEIETSSDAIICLPASVVLEAWSDQDPAEIWTYHWINSITGDTTSTVDGSFVASPLSSTIYTVFATDPNGCPSDDELINVNVLDDSSCTGCTTPVACNYDPEATIDDGSCEFICEGCTDEVACNYNPSANVDDSSCEYLSCAGCTDATACNFNLESTIDDHSCEYPQQYYDCDGNCLDDTDGDEVCDEFEILGCTDITACNYDATATADDGSCDYCSCDLVDSDSYSLTVESSAAVTAVGTTYRFYVNMSDPLDRMSAVYGDDDSNLIINTPAGAFNSAFNSSWSASGINPAFIAVFPDMADDSYATIGLDGPAASSGISNAADPSIVEDPIQPVTPFFTVDGATSLAVTTHIGASWYILNTHENGLPDTDLRVLVLQVTTTGDIGGTLNYQIFPLGNGSTPMQISTEFDGVGEFGSSQNEYGCGCTDETACNYDITAIYDDSLCSYISEGECDCDGNVLDALGECGGSCTADDDNDGICDDIDDCLGNNYDECGVCDGDNESCAGCTINFACNFDPTITVSNNTLCEYESCAGCTDEYACNFDPTATLDDGTYCLFIINGECDCEGTLLDGCGVCGGDNSTCLDECGVLYGDNSSCSGCTDATACNFDELATLDNGSCEYELDECGVCGGVGAIYDCGCANIPYGNCDCDGNVLDECGVCGGDGIADGDCDCDGNQLDVLGICDGSCTSDIDGNGVCDDVEIIGCMDATACNYDETVTQDDGTCEYGTCPGCTDINACNYNPVATFDDGSCEYSSCFVSCLGVTDATTLIQVRITTDNFPEETNWYIYTADGIYIDGLETDLNQAYTDFTWDVYLDMNECYVFTITDSYGDGLFASDFDANLANGSCSVVSLGTVEDQDSVIFSYNGSYFFSEIRIDFATTMMVLPEGCMHPLACNYDPSAIYDNSLCEYPSFGYDCLGECVVDTDGDGVCDVNETFGCLDTDACNYDATATDDDGTCLENDCAGVCGGSLLFDECGVCGGSEIVEGDCDCEGNQLDAIGDCGGDCGNDFNSNGICDEDEIFGCTYSTASNYSAEATIDDGSCVGAFNSCPSDLSGNGNVGSEDLLIFLADFDLSCDEISGIDVLGCTDDTACNYDSTATVDNGSCLDNDECGICGGDNTECLGCSDPEACNYEYAWMEDTIEDGSCEYPEDGYNCFGDCLNTLDDCGVCGGDNSTCLDECGVVNGDNSTCGCDGVPNYVVTHEGYNYSTVQIGEQCWFSENCRYLPEVSPSSAYSYTDAYYYVYGYVGSDVTAAQATDNYETYGVLYNWPAVMTEGICPSGWHIPSDGEFTELTDFLGGEGVAGGKMKEAGYDHWYSPNTGATNSSGWTGLPGGYSSEGGFYYVGVNGYWWSASESGSLSWRRKLNLNYGSVYSYFDNRIDGFSARCLRD